MMTDKAHTSTNATPQPDIYHSHPNHPAVPSEFDRSRATPWYSYVILSIVGREPQEVAAWRFDESTKRFEREEMVRLPTDRKSTRLNSSHLVISYAVFCLK